ncbi:MAG: aldehyde dehydrogenase family protein [Actinomycetota bacterium]|nr:aldehyde dehydrogenase family protein [Actinomycetota bacterium]
MDRKTQGRTDMTEHGTTPVAARSLVAGRWVDDGSWAERQGPFTGTVVSRALVGDAAMVEEALAYASGGARVVRSLTPARRADVLERASALADERREDLARLLALELGKPMKDSRGEIVRVADTFAICALEARQMGGEVLGAEGWERGRGTTALTYRAPVGVVVAITPFNAPANLLAHKLGASFAAGNTTIVKPPPQAPAASTAVVELLLDAGMPAEAVQVLHGGADVGSALVSSPVVGAVSFTGSAGAGAAVARAAGPKRLVLELGGNAATIVCEDADLDLAAANCARTGFSNSGQSCISVQRIYAHRSVFADFVERLVDAVGTLRVGDPLDEATDVGSMVDVAAAERVVSWVEEARRGGAQVPVGGVRHGATVEPTVVAGPEPDARVVVEEVFGALVAVLPYDDFDAVLTTCNESRYGLQAGLFTNDLRRVFRAWRELEVGGLVVNGSSNYRLDHVAFGGVKDSGIGRESPRWMIEDYTTVRTLLLRDVSLWSDT